jgi:hypothetical protein
MVYVLRDFNTPTNHIGDISIYLSNNNKICVTILNLHEHDYGQAWIYVKYSCKIDIYKTFLSILNKLTHDIFQEKLETGKKYGEFNHTDTLENIIPEYKDIMLINDNYPHVENIINSDDWGDYVLFTRGSAEYLKELQSDRDEEDKHPGLYIIKGETLENGEFIYDNPIRSNSYREENS